MKIDLEQYGWDAFFAEAKNASKNKHLEHGRVVSVHKSKYEVVKNDGIFSCEILGNIQYQKNPLSKPSVGDWVLLKKDVGTYVIVEVLKRKSLIKRQKKHDNFPKAIASNVDSAVIVQAIGPDYNVKRLERILVHIYDAGITPLFVINKIDKASNEDISKIKKELQEINDDIKIIFTSYKTGEGIDELENSFKKGETIIFIGSSGVGKSSIINHMLGDDILETQEVMKSTEKGRHTTTARRLIKLENGVLVIDTPGTREFGMHINDIEALKQSFDEIERISLNCKFSNCSHNNEVGCAVREALENGSIKTEVYERYLVLQNESQKTAKQMRQSGKQSSKNRTVEQPLRSIRRGKTKK
jgi:ribosome biogenesis GTPase